MKKTKLSSLMSFDVFKGAVLSVIFLLFALVLFLFLREDEGLSSEAQKWVYPLVMAGLLSALGTMVLACLTAPKDVPAKEHGPYFYPVISGMLALAGLCAAYWYLGLWPVGEKTGMTVDMHWQYAPLLAQLREMFLHGGSPLYTFEVGLGASFLPLFGYYLASPLNLLLVIFPEAYLPEAIILITLLKNALSAAFFAACVQYVYRRRNLSIPIVSVMYALMMYVLAYNWNIMWLDGVLILPLVVLGFEKLMRTGRFLPYVLSLAYALYANYYIGFMLCVFMVLYYIAYTLRTRRGAAKQARGFVRFLIGSALGGGLAMFLLVPVAMALGQTSAAGGTLPELKANFDLFNLLGRHLYGTTPTIRSGNLPNIYCGLLAVFLLPLFATLRSIPLRRRVTYLGLLAVIGLSFVLNQADLLWHGLHSPNDLPYRFSFLYCFVLLLIAYEALMHLREITFKQIAFTFLGIAAYLVLEDRFGDEAYGFTAIYVSLLLAAIYAGITALAARRHVAVRPAYALLLLVVSAEMIFHGGEAFRTLNSNEYFTNHDHYVDNDATNAIRLAVEKTKVDGDAAAGGEFYRLEKLPRKTCVDPALFHYRGLSVFASSNSYKTTKFMGSLGYAINGVNSYLYNSYVAPMDSLFGIRYVIAGAAESQPDLRRLDSVQVGEETVHIYENPDALPIAFVVDSAIKDWTADTWNPLSSQANLLSAMTGNEESLYAFQTIEVSENSLDIANTTGIYSFSINPAGDMDTAEFEVPIRDEGSVYIYVDCRAAKEIGVTVKGQDKKVTPREPYVIHAGALTRDDKVTVSIGAESAATGNIYVVTLNEPVYQEDMQRLRTGGLKVSSFTDSRIRGALSADKAGTVFTSIPYDSGWTVKVDGKPVETFGIGETDTEGAAGAMLAFDIEAGPHEVELSFFPRGLLLGLGLSAVSLILLCLLVWVTAKKRREAAQPPEAAGADAAGQPEEEPAWLGQAVIEDPPAAPAADADTAIAPEEEPPEAETPPADETPDKE